MYTRSFLGSLVSTPCYAITKQRWSSSWLNFESLSLSQLLNPLPPNLLPWCSLPPSRLGGKTLWRCLPFFHSILWNFAKLTLFIHVVEKQAALWCSLQCSVITAIAAAFIIPHRSKPQSPYSESSSQTSRSTCVSHPISQPPSSDSPREGLRLFILRQIWRWG